MTTPSKPHLESELLQALAEGTLPSGDERTARAHLDQCARCRSELEGWSLLFRELGSLEDLGPSKDFAERVMAGVEIAEPEPGRLSSLLDGLKGHLPTRVRGRTDRHLSPLGLQGYLEGLLDRSTRRGVEAHLASCMECQGELAQWKTVFGGLETLPHHAPSTAFADQVMAKVSPHAIAQAMPKPAPGLATRLVRGARRLVPESRKGRLVAGGVALAPAMGLTMAVAGIVLHPLVSLQGLATLASGWAGEAVGLAWSWGLGLMTDSWIIYQAMVLVDQISRAPEVLALGFVGLWAATLFSGWILYRYIIAPSLSTGHHVQAS